MKCALYHRVSSRDQDETLAREELGNAAKIRGYSIVLDVEESGSGARNDRPGLQQIMSAAKSGKISAVFVWKLDRFGRSSLDLLSNIKFLQSCGVRFCAVTQGLDVAPNSDSVSGLILGVLSAVAEFELNIIRERSRLGIEKARRSGTHCGRPPAKNTPPFKKVVLLREKGLSWARVASELGCHPSLARRVLSKGDT